MSKDAKSLPKHVAIIMDGNGRWAKSRFLNKSLGHRQGALTLKKIISYAQQVGISYLTVYAFSTENWKREEKEINYLMNLIREYIKDYLNDAIANNVKVDVIGDISKIPTDLQNEIKIMKSKTKDNYNINAIIALNYGGRDEIVRACKKLYNNLIINKESVNNIDEKIFEEYLDTYLIPDPDLIIRTSGELRQSNFLIWQGAYSEFHFTDKLWPDFDKEDLDIAIEEYMSRKRRFGGR